MNSFIVIIIHVINERSIQIRRHTGDDYDINKSFKRIIKTIKQHTVPFFLLFIIFWDLIAGLAS